MGIFRRNQLVIFLFFSCSFPLSALVSFIPIFVIFYLLSSVVLLFL
jgi:hypothetical protein